MQTETNDNLDGFLERHKDMIDAARRQAAAARPGDRIGEQVGPYKLLEILGEGGFGTVYLAQRTEPHHQQVALKIINERRDTKDTLARFEAERQALGLMNHDNVAKVFDAGATDEGDPYFAMEYIHGRPITEHCDEKRLDFSQRLALFVQVCEGVAHAHQKSIIHRDIKPSNVLASGTGRYSVAKVIDFGVAKAIGMPLTEKTLHTRQGMLIGTPEYMSPEQAKADNKDIDTRTDVYSLGVLLYELLTGVRPFDLGGKDTLEKLRIIREVEPLKPSTRLSSLVSERPSSRAGPKASPNVRNSTPTSFPWPVDVHGSDTLTRRRNGHSSVVTIAQHRRCDPKSLVRELRGDLDWITMKAMEKDRERRYKGVSEFAEDIRRHLRHEPVLAGPPEMTYRVKKFIRRHRSSVTAAALVAFALVAGVVGTTWGWVEASKALAQETQAKKDATEARDEANAVATFLRDMVRSAKSDRGKGRNARVPAYPPSPEMRKRLLGSNVDEIVAAMISFGSLLVAKRDYASADLLHLEALDIARMAPHADLEVVNILYNLATIAMLRGNADRAEAYYREALTALQKVGGEKNTLWPEVVNGFANVLRERGKLPEAEEHARLAVARQRQFRKGDHPWVAGSLDTLAFILMDRGDYRQAADVFREVLDMYRRLSGGEQGERDIARVLCGLGEALLRGGDLQGAEPLIGEGLKMQQELEEIDPTEASVCQNAMGRTLLSRGNAQGAQEKFARSLRILEKKRPAGDWIIARTEGDLGRCLTELGRFAEAEQRLHSAHSCLERARGPNDPYAQEVLRGIINLYEVSGQAEKLDKYNPMLVAPKPPGAPE